MYELVALLVVFAVKLCAVFAALMAIFSTTQ